MIDEIYSKVVYADTFDAVNTTNFGAKSGSWREAFGRCFSLRNLYIKNLTVNLNISWSPISYESISYIISAAANTSAITISVSPYTYNLLSPSDFELATSKNITIALLTGNYVEDRRLSDIANKVTSPPSPVAGDLLMFDGTDWISTTIAELVEETTLICLKVIHLLYLLLKEYDLKSQLIVTEY